MPDVHIKPRRGTLRIIGAKLNALGRIQRAEPRVEALLRLLTDVLEVRFHLNYPLDSAERSVARDVGIQIELKERIEALEPLLE